MMGAMSLATMMVVAAMTIFVAAGAAAFVILLRSHSVIPEESKDHDYNGKP